MSAYLSNAAVEAILGYLRDEIGFESFARDLSAHIDQLAAENARLREACQAAEMKGEVAMGRGSQAHRLVMVQEDLAPIIEAAYREGFNDGAYCVEESAKPYKYVNAAWLQSETRAALPHLLETCSALSRLRDEIRENYPDSELGVKP